jgi:hypothetical protein
VFCPFPLMHPGTLGLLPLKFTVAPLRLTLLRSLLLLNLPSNGI